MEEKKPAARLADLGPTGRAFAANLARLRRDRGFSFQALADRTEQLGYAVPAIGLRRIEGEARKVTVDEVMVLARALETSPLDLMLPAADAEVAELTGGPRQTGLEAWGWARGLETPEAVGGWIARLREVVDRGNDVIRLGLTQLGENPQAYTEVTAKLSAMAPRRLTAESILERMLIETLERYAGARSKGAEGRDR